MHKVQDVCSNLIIQGLIKVEVFIVKSLPQILIQNPLNFHLSKFQGFLTKEGHVWRKKVFRSFSSIHPSIHPSTGLFQCGLLLASPVARLARQKRSSQLASVRTGGDDALRSRERRRDFCNAHNAISFPYRCSLFLLPSAKFIAVFTGLFLVMDSSRSAGVQEVRGERESRRIFSSSSKLLLLLRLWQATNRENSARIEDVQVCVVTC